MKNQDRIRAKIVDPVPKMSDSDIIELNEKYNNRNHEDLAKGFQDMQLLRLDR